MSLLENWKKRKEAKKALKYKKGLKKSSLIFSKELKKISNKYANKPYSKEYLNDLESILVASDMGIKNSLEIVSKLNKVASKTDSLNKINEKLIEIIINQYSKGNYSNKLNLKKNRLNVILMVGVNGTGKTTTVAKIANKLLLNDWKVLLVAADTFRAGAVEQLEHWAKILKIEIVKPNKLNQDPASLVFQALTKAKNENYDCVLIDTAGRLQNKINLMNELSKIKNVIKKHVSNAPHETLLVLDAITGQNGLIQAKVFSDNVNVTGIILTKMDGSARGGICFAIKSQLNIPIKFIGFGEKIEDLEEFNIEDYVYGLTNNIFEKDISNEVN